MVHEGHSLLQTADYATAILRQAIEKIAAAVELTPPRCLSEEDVAAWVRTEMGGAYAPEVVLALPEMPTIDSNKPDRDLLRSLAVDRIKNRAE